MRQRTFRLCICSHRRRIHSKGVCEDCKSNCVFKEGSEPNVIPQKRASGGGATGENVVYSSE